MNQTICRQPERHHVDAFTTGMVRQYWINVQGRPAEGERFEEFLADSCTKVWEYVTRDRSTRDFHDYQCVIAIEARQVFAPLALA